MYLGGFYEFPKFRQNRPKNALFLAKNGHFCRNSGMQLKKKLWRKINQVLGKWSNWPKNWYKCTLGYLLQLQMGIFGYLAFLQFYGCRNASRGRFLAKNGQIYPKIALSAHLGSRKIVKKQNIQKSRCKVVANTPRYIYTNF